MSFFNFDDGGAPPPPGKGDADPMDLDDEFDSSDEDDSSDDDELEYVDRAPTSTNKDELLRLIELRDGFSSASIAAVEREFSPASGESHRADPTAQAEPTANPRRALHHAILQSLRSGRQRSMPLLRAAIEAYSVEFLLSEREWVLYLSEEVAWFMAVSGTAPSSAAGGRKSGSWQYVWDRSTSAAGGRIVVGWICFF